MFFYERKDNAMKKPIAVIAAAAIAAGAIAPCCYAEEKKETSPSSSQAQTKEDDGMTEALSMVKSRITVPSEYSEFSCTAGEYRGVKSFTFQWTKPGSYNSYYVRVEGDIITEYNTPDRYSSYDKKGFSEYSRRDFINKAQSWVYKVNPSMKGFLTPDENVNLYLNSDSVYVGFTRNYGGTRVKNNSVSVWLSKYTGEVTGYSASWWQGAKFSPITKAVPEADIRKTYSDEFTLKPWYRISTSDSGEKTASIVYEPQSSFIYDALTGEHSTMNEDYLAALDTDEYLDSGYALDGEGAVTEEEAAEDCVEAVPMSSDFTEQEKAAVADMSKMLTSEQFKSLMLKDKYMGITEKHLVNDFSINANDNADCGFAISCNFHINNKTDYSSIYVEADAESGKVLSFNNYSLESKKELDVKKASDLAEKAAEYYYGDIFGEYKSDPENTAPAVSTDKYKVSSRRFKYYRYVNNIQVTGDTVTVTVNADGKVTGISCFYTKDADFGDGKVISKETALSMLFEQKPMTLYYDGFTDLKSVPHTYLIYTMESWNLNAKTGKLCDYYGNTLAETSENTGECPYKDIEKSKYKDEIALMYSYGIKLGDSDKFLPNEKITETELLQLLETVRNGYPMPLEETVYEEHVGGVSDKTALTRRQLARLIVKDAQADRFADKNEIFRSPFKDVNETDKDLGYIAIAWARGIIEGDENGNFTPEGYVTREYAFHCIYKMIENNK